MCTRWFKRTHTLLTSVEFKTLGIHDRQYSSEGILRRQRERSAGADQRVESTTTSAQSAHDTSDKQRLRDGICKLGMYKTHTHTLTHTTPPYSLAQTRGAAIATTHSTQHTVHTQQAYTTTRTCEMSTCSLLCTHGGYTVHVTSQHSNVPRCRIIEELCETLAG